MCKKKDMNIKYPKNEILWVTYEKEERPIAIITSKELRDMYYLYKVNIDGSVERIARSPDPDELHNKFEEKINK